ncbi:hypothetical protein Tco_0709765 [Tanacetum coccineum]
MSLNNDLRGHNRLHNWYQSLVALDLGFYKVFVLKKMKGVEFLIFSEKLIWFTTLVIQAKVTRVLLVRGLIAEFEGIQNRLSQLCTEKECDTSFMEAVMGYGVCVFGMRYLMYCPLWIYAAMVYTFNIVRRDNYHGEHLFIWRTVLLWRTVLSWKIVEYYMVECKFNSDWATLLYTRYWEDHRSDIG